MEGCLLLLVQNRQHDVVQVRAGMAPVVGVGMLSQHLGHPLQQVGWRQCSHLCTAKCQALHLPRRQSGSFTVCSLRLERFMAGAKIARGIMSLRRMALHEMDTSLACY